MFKGKTQNNPEDSTNPKAILNTIYKKLEFSKNIVDEVIEYEVSMTDTTTDGKPYAIRNYTIKISHDISFSSKTFNLTNKLTSSRLEVIPCSGIEKVTTEFKCSLNYGYDYDFNFKFWHRTAEESSTSDKAYIYWGLGGSIRNPEYPEGLEELIYEIQRDIQKAIENARR
ncbi:hypothetical protein [Bacillus mycoides]|uniref:hypothetical protein n=1 Tax=Bacillus mycoides TaxID=1405 RepID=UPI0020798B0E|nr:hypothetical protein [Bacillus mycoides]